MQNITGNPRKCRGIAADGLHSPDTGADTDDTLQTVEFRLRRHGWAARGVLPVLVSVCLFLCGVSPEGFRTTSAIRHFRLTA